MTSPVIKATSYILVHTPNTLIYHGATQTMERQKNPESEYLQKLPQFLRSFAETLTYPANQAYIGNISVEELRAIDQPWYENSPENAARFSDWGEIMPEDEFYGILQIVDAFDLVKLSENFAQQVKEKLTVHPLITAGELEKIKGTEVENINSLVKGHLAEPLYLGEELVGCIKQAHDTDVNLNAHVMLENMMAKASGVLALKHLVKQEGIAVGDVDYIIEVSEEACGDINQRGGGNFAKSVAEAAGCVNATGSDTRSFCAGPTHGLINATALVKAGIYDNVVVVAGGATAKLGMNGKDHLAKNMPLLEDCLGGFAILVSKNDGINPIVRTDAIGRHTVGTGSSPQAVISALVTNPLDKLGLKITDIDKYSVEMQNPEITRPAGAGDVPTANYKMIAALGVKRGDLERNDIARFVEVHGMPGFAPTQGHIPSGVPFIGHARRLMLNGQIRSSMIIGKGSLFLGRMTNLFDGVSFIIEQNSGQVETDNGVNEDMLKKIVGQAMRELARSLLKEEA